MNINNKLNSLKKMFCEENIIEISNTTSAIIQGTNGILIYEENAICIKLAEKKVLFSGKNLIIKNFSEENVEIFGDIEKIEFLK